MQKERVLLSDLSSFLFFQNGKCKKKGQGLSLNTIVIAIIVLVVVSMLILIFTGQIGVFTNRISDCQSIGGVCTEGGCGRDIFGHGVETLNPKTPCSGGICCTRVPGGPASPSTAPTAPAAPAAPAAPTCADISNSGDC